MSRSGKSSAATSGQIGGKRCNNFESRHCLQLGHLLDCWNGLFDTEHVCSGDHPWWTPGATVNLPKALVTVLRQRPAKTHLTSIYVQIKLIYNIYIYIIYIISSQAGREAAGPLFKLLSRLGAQVHAVLGVAFIVRMCPRDPTILPGDTLRHQRNHKVGH